MGVAVSGQPERHGREGGAPPLVVLAAGRAGRVGGCKPLAPVGPGDEAVIDVLASDALEAGYGRVVLVVNAETGPRLREHVERRWRDALSVAFAEQARASGTVGAVLAARHEFDAAAAFAMANADDCYGAEALAMLAGGLVVPSGGGAGGPARRSTSWSASASPGPSSARAR